MLRYAFSCPDEFMGKSNWFLMQQETSWCGQTHSGRTIFRHFIYLFVSGLCVTNWSECIGEDGEWRMKKKPTATLYNKHILWYVSTEADDDESNVRHYFFLKCRTEWKEQIEKESKLYAMDVKR